MGTRGYARLFATILAGAASISAANAQVTLAAALAVDGIHAVDITTRHGAYEKAYHWTISVSGGRVKSVGATRMAALGQTSGSGTVDLLDCDVSLDRVCARSAAAHGRDL